LQVATGKLQGNNGVMDFGQYRTKQLFDNVICTGYETEFRHNEWYIGETCKREMSNIRCQVQVRIADIDRSHECSLH